MSLVSSGLGQFLRFSLVFLFFNDIGSFEEYWSVFYRLPFNLDFSDGFPWFESWGWIIPQKWKALLVTSLEGDTISTWYHGEVLNLWLGKVVFFRFLKLTLLLPVHTLLFGSGSLSLVHVQVCECDGERIKLHLFTYIIWNSLVKKIFLFSLTYIFNNLFIWVWTCEYLYTCQV